MVMIIFLKEATKATSESVLGKALHILYWEYFHTEIIQQPQDIVLFLSSQEQDVTFDCKIELAHLGFDWKVNGTDLPGSQIRQTFSGNITTVKLTFPAQSSYNHTTIQCIGYGLSDTVK